MATAVIAVGSLAAGALSGGTLLAAVSSLALSVGVSWAASALAPEPSSPSFSQSGRALSFRSEAAVRPIILGTVRVSGPITFARVGNVSATPLFGGDEGRVLHLIIPLAGHPVDAVTRVWFGETELQIEPNGQVAGPFQGNMVVKRYTGAPDQQADPDLLAAFPDLDANFRGRCVPYLYCALRRNQEVYPQGLLNFSAEVKGARMHDPRAVAHQVNEPATWSWSENAELAIIHYMRGCPFHNANGEMIRPYGLALPDDRFGDWSEVAAEANICDELVPLAGGGTEKRYTLNGSVSSESAPRNELPRLMSAMAGRLNHQPRRWVVQAGAARPVAFYWSRADLRGEGLTVQPSRSLGQLATEIQGRFVDGETYREGTYPIIRAPQFETKIFGPVRRVIDFPYTNSGTGCQRLAKIALLQAQKQKSVKTRLSYAQLLATNGDWVTWNDAVHGFANQPMEIANVTLGTYASDETADGVALGLEFEMQEVGADVFAWNAAEEEGLVHVGQGASLPDALNVPAPVSLTAEVIEFGEAATVELKAGGSASDIDFDYRFSRKLQGAASFTETATQRSPVRIERGVPPGEHIFRVQAVSRLGRASPPRDVTLTVGAPALVDLVAGLELVGQGRSESFEGPDAAFSWRRGAVDAPGLDEAGADLFSGDEHFAGYDVRIFTGRYTGREANPIILRSERLTSEGYTYFLDFNRQDARRARLASPAREITIEVVQRGRWGQETIFSEPAYKTASNSAPAQVTGLSVRRGHRSAWVKFQTKPDGDLAGVVVRSDVNAEFDPALGHGRLDYEGDLTNEVQLDVAPGETRYVRLAAFDAFGKTGLNWSPALEVTSQALTVNDFDPAVQAGLAAAEAVGDEYFLRVNGEGRIIGFALLGGETSNAAFLVDKFQIAKPGDEPIPVFEVDSETGSVRLNELFAASITTDEFKAAYADVDELVGGVIRSNDGLMVINFDQKFFEIS
ncbi:MAG: hypothetical protein P1U84_12220 [Parvibaculaceae bacterium]|nr:hypothetical protein [Parvibaculaceae bacterium]